MFINFGSWDAICWTGRTVLPFLALAVTGVAVGIVSISKLPERCCSKKDDDCNTDEDLISQLPDELLGDILSRLCLLDAARTRLVSRKWRNICAFRSMLTFNCLDMFGKTGLHSFASPRRCCRFVRAVDQTLRLYAGRKISYAMLSCCFAYECLNLGGGCKPLLVWALKNLTFSTSVMPFQRTENTITWLSFLFSPSIFYSTQNL